MKLRMRGNALRLRLTRKEVAELAGAGFVENQVQLGELPECALVYRLTLSEAVTTPTTTFHGTRLCIHLPAAEGRNWARTEKIGIYGEETWGLKLAVEKDFKCLDPLRDEDESDAFENPHGTYHEACVATSD